MRAVLYITVGYIRYQCSINLLTSDKNAEVGRVPKNCTQVKVKVIV